jgi:hypothetical protein
VSCSQVPVLRACQLTKRIIESQLTLILYKICLLYCHLEIEYNIRYQSRDDIYPVLKGSGFVKR